MAKWVFLASIWIAVIIRYGSAVNNEVKIKSGETVKLETGVDSIPKGGSGGEELVVIAGKDKIWVKVPKEVSADYGDRVIVIGKLKELVINKKVIGFELIPSYFTKIDGKKGPMYWLYALRRMMINRLGRWIPGDEGALGAGILVGGSDLMSEKGKTAFRRSGLTHVVAASGYNVSVVAGWAMAMGWRMFGRKRAIYFVILCISVYMVLAGLGAAIIRAGLMGIISVIGLALGRKSDGFWLLALTAGLMCLLSPLWIRDIGFQLSVSATAGILVYETVKIKTNALIESLVVTVAAYAFTLPLILHHFGNLSVIAPVINVVTLWTVPLAMPILAVAIGVGLIWPGGGQLISLLAWPLLKWMTWVVGLAGNWKYASLEVGNMGWGWVVTYYLAIILILNLACRQTGFQFLITKFKGFKV